MFGVRKLLVYLSMLDSSDDRYKFEVIYNTYKQLMYYIADDILGDTTDSEDVVHEAFLKIIEVFEKIKNPTSPQTRSLIVTITENKAIDLYRKRKKISIVPYEEKYLGIPERSKIDQIADKEIVAKAILSLPGKYREVLLLKYAQGYSTDEIAVILSLTKENVKKTIQRARKRLEEVLSTEEA